MTRVEIKKEIGKLLDNVPDEILQELLMVLKKMESNKMAKESMARHLDKILKEDKELLTRLAQ